MRIFHADTDDMSNPQSGGQPVRTYEVNSRLASRHDITVCTATFPNAQERVLKRSGISYRRVGLYIPPFGLSPHLSYLASLGFQLRRTPHDLVVEEFMAPTGFSMLPLWTDKPVICIVQWFFFEFWEQRYHLPFYRWMKALARQKRYLRFIVQTMAMGKIFSEIVPSADIRKIPCGINAEAFKDAKTDGEYALFLGRMEMQQKGLDCLLDAWTNLCAAHRVPLVLAGDGPDREQLEALVRERGLSGMVRFVGRVQGEAKDKLLRNCRFLVMPSRAETFGLVALEAMAVSRPVLAFDIPHLNELVRSEWGVLVDVENIVQFGQAVCELWSNPAHCRCLGERAGATAKQYDWDHIAKIQEEYYLEVVSQGIVI